MRARWNMTQRLFCENPERLAYLHSIQPIHFPKHKDVCDPLGQFVQGFAQLRGLDRLEGAARHRLLGGFLAYAIALRVGQFGVQLQQPRDDDVGFFFRADHVEFARIVPEKLEAFSAVGMVMLNQSRQASRQSRYSEVFQIEWCDSLVVTSSEVDGHYSPGVYSQ